MNKVKYYLLNTFLLVMSFVPLLLLFVFKLGVSGDSKFIYLGIIFIVGGILISLQDSLNIEGSKLNFFIGKPLKFHSIDINQIGRIDISDQDLGNKDVNLSNLLLLFSGKGLPTISIFTKENNILLSYSLKKEDIERFQLVIPKLLVINPSIVINETIASSVNKTPIKYSEDFFNVLIISILAFFFVLILLAMFVNLIPF